MLELLEMVFGKLIQMVEHLHLVLVLMQHTVE
jgi:hypothetical protein